MPGRPHLRTRVRVLPGAFLSLLSLVLVGCTGGSGDSGDPASPVAVAAGVASTACDRFLAAVPDRLGDLSPRPVTPTDSPALAWGDPAVTLTCGVGRPAEMTRAASCLEVDGVGWFVSPEQLDDTSLPVAATAIEVRPRVRLDVPATWRGSVLAAALADLTAPVRATLDRDPSHRCD